MKRALLLLTFVIPFTFGCDSNPTNAPSIQDVKAADAKRAAAIDADPRLTPEQKQMQKQAAGLLPGGRGGPMQGKPGSAAGK